MKRKRSTIFQILFSSLGILSLLNMVYGQKPVRKVKKQPNIIFILSDDQRADAMSCAGNTVIKTPNIDLLAQNGIRFVNSHIMGGNQGAVSAPSRAMLLSGKNLFNVYDKLNGVQTFPMYFAQHGYQTFATGKWHNEKQAFEASFQQAKDVFLGGMCDHFNVPCRDMDSTGKLGNPVIKGYSTDIFANAAIHFIDSYAEGNRDKPFLLYLAFTAPHDPRSPKPDYIGKYNDTTIKLPGNFMNLHPFAFDDLSIRDENLAPWPRTADVIKASLADYYALISHMDDKIGEIINALKSNDLYDNTLIIFASDNGLAIGSHGLMGKQNLYEHSTNVPLIICGPGIPKNKVSDAMVYLFDIYPTLCNLCNLTIPKGIDGKDFSNVIKANSNDFRTSLYTAYRNTVRAVRTKDWKLIRYPYRNYNQLFNLSTDSLELNNLAPNTNYKAKLAEMMSLLQKNRKENNDTINLFPQDILPLKYDYKLLKQQPDNIQPDYILKKYFKAVVLKETDSIKH